MTRTFVVRRPVRTRDYRVRFSKSRFAQYYLCAPAFERLTGLKLKPGESARVRLVRYVPATVRRP